MKTMKQKNGLPIRVKEEEVAKKIEAGYCFCPRSEWKNLVRDVNKTKKTDDTVCAVVTETTPSKKSKRQK